MSDHEIDFFPKDKEIHIVATEEDVPVDEDTMLFNAGHTSRMGRTLNRIFKNEFAKIYQIGESSDRFVTTLDMEGFLDSTYMRDPRVLNELLHFGYQELRMNATMPQGYMQLAEKIPDNAEKYEDLINNSLKVLNRNSRMLGRLVERTEDRGLVTAQNERFIENIQETIKLAETLYKENGQRKSK